MVFLQVIGLVHFAHKDSQGMPIWKAKDALVEVEPKHSKFNWFERTNYHHLRDIQALEQLNSILKPLAQRKEVISLMSRQMGMIPYYLSADYGNQIQFLDSRGITDRTFTSCTLTSDLPRSWFGLHVGYKFYLPNSARIEQSCGIPPPDIIYDLEFYDESRVVAENGYTVVSRLRKGELRTSDPAFPKGGYAPVPFFVAVRSDLWECTD